MIWPKRSLLLASIAAAISLASGFPAHAAGESEEQAVRAIRRQYDAINSRVRHRQRRVRRVFDYSTEGGEVSSVASGPARKVVVHLLGCSGQWIDEYYFWDGRLVFAFSTTLRYTMPVSGVIARRYESRLYFRGGCLVRWIGSAKEPALRDVKAWLKQQEAALADARRWLALSRG